jgi:UDP-glucose 4-epimerase
VPARRVLITGVGSYLGTLLAARLERDPQVEAVIGIDTRRPAAELGRTELREADIRDAEMHDINVIGSLQLLAACERVPSIRSIVIRGSAGIYGAEPHAPQFLGEEMTQLFPLRTRFQRDVAEIENYFETFSRRRPQVTCTMLRYQPAIGPSLDTQITRYLTQPACPTYLGFDPRIQLVHEHDALEALLAAIRNPVRGAVNVAGRGTIGLGRMVRLAGRPPFPIAGPLFGPLTEAARRLGLGAYSDDFRRLLRYGRAVDIRRLEEEVGYEPRYSTLAAVQDWVARRGEARAA